MGPGFCSCEPLSVFSVGYHVFLSSLNRPPELTNFFHCVSFSLSFLTIRHASPLPSMIPFPVMAILTAPVAEMGDWFLICGKPSQFAFTSGYSLKSFVNNKVEPVARYKLMLLFKTTGPVNHKPAGTITVPPPFLFN